MFEQIFENVRQKSPLIHNITNYVTVNDCANMLLACGGSPIMADDLEDAVEITAICGGLNINIGTLNQRTVPVMFAAGKRANELGHPVVLDPVGAGASRLRTDTALGLLEKVRFSVIRGNISEMKTLALGSGTTKGVDADGADRVTEDNLEEVIWFAENFAKKIGTVITITGAIDIVTDGERAFSSATGARRCPLLPAPDANFPPLPRLLSPQTRNGFWRQRRRPHAPWGCAGKSHTDG